MEPEQVCRLLAEPRRLRVHAAVVLGADTPAAIATATGLSAREVAQAVARLGQGGLVHTEAGRLRVADDVFADAVRAAVPPPEPDQPLDPDADRAAVLRAFVRDGRLAQMPAARGKRRVVLEHIAACFEPGVRYPERAVNAVLRAWYPDHAALRRYLVDEGLMSRDAGLYWRSGGTVDV